MESKLFKSLSYIRADFPWSFGKLTITQTFKNLIIQIQNVVKQAKGISLLNVFSLFHFLWVASRRMTWLLSWTGLPLSIRYLSPSFQAQREPDLRPTEGGERRGRVAGGGGHAAGGWNRYKQQPLRRGARDAAAGSCLCNNCRKSYRIAS